MLLIKITVMKQRVHYLIGFIIALLPYAGITQTDYFLRAGGNITTLADWGINGDGSGTNPTDFVSSDNWHITNNNSSITLSAAWNLDAGASVFIGDGLASNTLVIGTGGSMPNDPVITINDLATLDIETNYTLPATADPQTGSTVIFGSNAPNLGLVYASNLYNAVIADDIVLTTNGIVVDGTLTINAGITFSLNSLAITVKALDCVGQLDGGATGNSAMTINGEGGTIRFKPGGQRLSRLSISLAPNTSTLTLASDLTIDGTANSSFSAGRFEIGANQLFLNGRVTFANSTNFGFIGSSNSHISIGATSAVGLTNSLRMVSGSNTLGRLTMNRTGTVVTIGAAMEITDVLTVSAGTVASGGNITLNADATQAAAVAALCSTCAVTGSVTVESFLGASAWPGGNGGWGLYGSNGVSGKTIANWETQVPMTCNGCIYGPTAAGNFTSVQGWDNTACDFITNLTSATALSPGKGFWVYMATGFPTSNLSWSFSGTLAQGNVVQTVDYGGPCTTYTGLDGYNLLANPYASPISWDAVSASNTDITEFVYYYTEGNSSASYQAGFGGTGTGANVIPAGQGFFVDNQIFGTGSVTFNESHKIPGNNTTLLWKGPRPVTSVNNHNAFRLHVDGALDKDDALFRMKPSASFEYSKKEDGIKVFETPGYGGSSPNIYSKYTSISSQDPVSGRYMSINNFPPSSKRTIIPILVRVSTTGSYTLDASDYDNYQSCIVVRDKLTNVYADLKVAPYVFTISDTTSTPRFELIVCENGGGVVSVNDLYSSENISIGKDSEGPVVKTDFDKPTDAVISVYNLLGQQLKEVKVSGAQTTTHINDANLNNQVIIIKVTADNHSVSKKLLVD